MILTKNQILEAQDIQTRTIPVPEWGGDVIVKGMMGDERDAFEASCNVYDPKTGKHTGTDLNHARAKMAAQTIVDEQGNLIFSEDDIIALGKKSAKALTRVFNAATELSGMTEKDMEELTKNSESAPSGASTSA